MSTDSSGVGGPEEPRSEVPEVLQDAQGPQGVRSSQSSQGIRPGVPRPDDDGVTRYAAEVRAELSDLAPEQSADLLEDLEDHLRELSADVGEFGDLWTYLGAPADYASELRASAGLPPRVETEVPQGTRSRKRSFARRVRDRATGWRDSFAGTRASAAVVDFLPSLQPAWWIVRAWAVVQVLAWMTASGPQAVATLVPEPGNSYLLGLLLLAITIPASVWFARRPPLAGRRARAFAVLQTGLAVLTLAALLPQDSGGDYGSARAFPNSYADSTPGLVDDGRPVTNLFVYDQAGRLLNGVYVYDQDGNPVDVGGFGAGDGSIYGGAPLFDQSGGDGIFEAQQWLDGQGLTVVNRFPQYEARVVYPSSGAPQLVGIPWTTVQVPRGVHSVPLVGTVPSDGGTGPTASPSSGGPGAPSASDTSTTPAPATTPATTPTGTPAPPASSASPGASPPRTPSATPTPVSSPSAPATTR